MLADDAGALWQDDLFAPGRVGPDPGPPPGRANLGEAASMVGRSEAAGDPSGLLAHRPLALEPESLAPQPERLELQNRAEPNPSYPKAPEFLGPPAAVGAPLRGPGMTRKDH